MFGSPDARGLDMRILSSITGAEFEEPQL